MVLMWLVKQKDRLVGVIYLKNKQAEEVWNKTKQTNKKVGASVTCTPGEIKVYFLDRF